MAEVSEAMPMQSAAMNFFQSPMGRNVMMGSGVAAVLSLMIGVWLWGQQPEYKVLFSNFSDRDGGAIVSSLQQNNIPYKFSESGSAILVPSNQVYDARLKMAAQGLPKGGNVGFELMENQKLGVSQFLEQVNFQRALEGELAKSIQSLGPVVSARVHLALPKASVFVREQQKPTASVILTLHPNRTLDQLQVNAVVHLVASSVPDLPTKNVTVVDQAGNLISELPKPMGNTLDPSQLKYVQEVQQSVIKRIESIITPIVGANNVHAEATADIDFSHTEQAAESYGPNQPPNAASVRSLQSSESATNNPNSPSGIPGALTNQPPAPATAPIVGAPVTGATTPATGNSRKDVTTNFEVDKTIRYVQQNMGGVKRLSVAVVVNYKREVDKNGKTVNKPLSEEEKTQITDLAKEAMGFSKERGDTLNVVNSPFAGPNKDEGPEVPWWKQQWVLEAAKDSTKYIAAGVLILYLFFGVLRPMMYKFMGPTQEEIDAAIEAAAEEARAAAEAEAAAAAEALILANEAAKIEEAGIDPMGPKRQAHENDLEAARRLAREDARMVAAILTGWMGGDLE